MAKTFEVWSLGVDEDKFMENIYFCVHFFFFFLNW